MLHSASQAPRDVRVDENAGVVSCGIERRGSALFASGLGSRTRTLHFARPESVVGRMVPTSLIGEDLVNDMRLAFARSAYLSLGVVACAAQLSVDELTSGLVVATKFDSGVDFGSFNSFAVNPTVSLVTGGLEGGTFASETAQGIVQRITSNMSSRGYDLVATSERPSLGLQATVY